jgi:hypothetical protein
MTVMRTRSRLCAAFLLAIVLVSSCAPPPQVVPPSGTVAWDPFLDTLQERTLRYFLETTPASGLAYDRYPSSSPSSIGAVGFALTCYPIAVERGLSRRAEAAQRVRNTLLFLLQIPQGNSRAGIGGYKGFFYHFLDVRDGTRVWNCELSTVDTGLMLMGALFCQSYFNRPDSVEDGIRALADTLYRRVDWLWAANGAEGISHAWWPEKGFNTTRWRGYDESAFLMFLALGSPTHPVPETIWPFWTGPNIWAQYQGFEFISFGPMFGHHYSHCWIDFRGIRDSYARSKGIDYFENSRRATYSQRIYGSKNVDGFRGFSDSIWGLTACDGPNDTTFSVDGRLRTFHGYSARGASFDWVMNDGTIAPTAAGGSVAFAPEICIPALKAMRLVHGDSLFRRYGFADAFNPTYVTPRSPGGWYDPDHIGIDQGPIAIMIENLRSGFVWEVMKRNPHIVRGLRRAGFSGGWMGQP